MGTNYYHRTNICESCNRFDERHIGKSSAGWQFNFQGYDGKDGDPKILSFKDWLNYLCNRGKIFSEYDEEITVENFVELVKSKQSQPNNHYDYCKEHHKEQGFSMSNDWKDSEGYAFTSADFS